MWRRRKGGGESDGELAGLDTGVGDECEAFLAGRLAAYLQDLGRPVPAVGWLNQVVHATPRELSLLAVTGEAYALQPRLWCRAVGYLARNLLERARETGRPIEQLQRELLVPLELELIGDPAAADLDSDDMTRLTMARLYELPELST
ncbi:MAG: hypothetical protein AB1679_01290 [Actinomycetota bacterium]|jgi:hypothetical protein